MELLKPFIDELTKKIADDTIARIDARIAELAKKQYKPFYTFAEMTEIFGCSISTIRLRAKAGVLAYSKNFNGANGCTTQQIEDYFKRMEVR